MVPGGGSSSLRSDEAGIAGFRRSGLAGDGRADVPEPAAEAGREELFAWFVISEASAQGNCVEVADQAGRVLVRDTKDRTGPMLSLSVDAWRMFADQMKDR